MPLRDLDYQARVLAAFDGYLAELSEQKKRADGIAELSRQNPGLKLEAPDFPAETWEALRASGKLPPSRANTPHSPRRDGVGRPVPNAVFKVPTGGGKTYLAVSALSRLFGRYLGRNTGFVLWIVPNEAIYTQTRQHLNDRQHPYRQMLDVLSGNRVKLMEKTDPLNAHDVEEQLCVMVLMLQASNRENKDSLKIFQDRGDVHGFFPPEGDMEAHRLLLEQIPNLQAYSDSAHADAFWPMVKDSLGNALRLIRPVVVMDEGHRATSELAYATLYGFNPCFVLELTATPKDVAASGGKKPRPARHSNILVEVRGTDLDREGMIKMPLNLDPREGTDWRGTLKAALDRLNELDGAARHLHGERGRYIRPILLVQVERTGKEQRDGTHIHALDVKDWLATAGLDEPEIAIKTAETNDLANPENLDLLSPTNRVRVIVTKQALQEGWDCPFAYVLCALAASANLSALTQLIGRVLRQPHAEKTEIPLLDESYVVTHHANTAKVVEAIKKGLEEDGLGDLVKEIRLEEGGDGSEAGPRLRKIPRRHQFAKTEIYLPKVLCVGENAVRELDYEQDILFELDWSNLDPSPLVAKLPDHLQAPERQIRRIRLAESGQKRIIDEVSGHVAESVRFDPGYAVRMISDIVPNPWVGREIVGRVMDGLMARGFDAEKLGAGANLIVEELRKWLDQERDRLAEACFRQGVAEGRIQFRLRTDRHIWAVPKETDTYQPEGAEHLVGKHGGALERSLFAPMYKGDFNQDEREVAVYLDGEAALTWWHRNVARTQYAIQGWRRAKIYPDFIFALNRGDGKNRLMVLETKGDHLAGNLDTTYKQSVLRLMTESYPVEQATPVGELELVVPDGAVVQCDLVLMSEWKTRLPTVIHRNDQS
ncbi:DEAD/DEAH box helicase [Methylomagnum sp.]